MRAKSVAITPVLNGFIVKVGCQEVVFQSLGYLLQEIERYYKNPEEVEKEYLVEAINVPNPIATQPVPRKEIDHYVGIGTPEPYAGSVRAR